MAGFSVQDAQTVSYASQYADDATEHKKIRIANIPDQRNYRDYDGKYFDPVCTAHSGKNWMSNLWKWAKFYLKPKVQRHVLMAFHYLPPNEKKRGGRLGDYKFITEKNSPLARKLLNEAVKKIENSTPGSYEYEFALVKLGLALHTYADTWAHAGFSGRHSSIENDIKNIRTKENNKFKKIGVLKNIVSYAAPDVGHSEASGIPDASDISWKAGYAAGKRKAINRNNTDEFMESSETIYKKLASLSPAPKQKWNKISKKIALCLKKKETWQNAFPGIRFEYSRFTWREAALCGDTVDWDDFDCSDDFAKLDLKWSGNDVKWFLFHKAALEQRVFLSGKIPGTWTST